VGGGDVDGETGGDEAAGAGGSVVVVGDGGGAGGVTWVVVVVVAVDRDTFASSSHPGSRTPDESGDRVGRTDDELHWAPPGGVGDGLDNVKADVTITTTMAMSAARCLRIWHLPLGSVPGQRGVDNGISL
jgi:hypothetical protein